MDLPEFFAYLAAIVLINCFYMMNDHDIPQDLYSFEKDRPFDRCIECNKFLLNEDTEYLIEKAIRNYQGFQAKDVIFDYAICMDCAKVLRKQISVGSWQQIMTYFQKNLNVSNWIRTKEESEKPGENLKVCMIKEPLRIYVANIRSMRIVKERN